ncbi:MAG: efflux transporter outer membrane subunit [Caulobacteraceae bacterium]|nr:efflux transporter outer membrane subunit [Caulobacteraceae bacterium]
MIRQAPRLILALAAAALAGCQLAPDHTAPATASPPAWRQGSVTQAWPATDWWRGFKSPQLDRLLADAEADNDDLKAAAARVREADAQARIAGAALLPTVGLGAGGEATRIVNPLGKERHNLNASAELGVAYELDFWGKNRAAATAAEQTAQAARYDQAVVRLTVLTSVADAYFQARALRDQLDIARQQAALAQAQLDATRAKFAQGLVDAQSLALAEAQVQTAQAATGPLAGALTHMLDALAILTGRSPETIEIDRAPLDAVAAPDLGAGLPSQLLLHRPDVQRSEAALAAANADITVARADLLPSFNLTAAGGVESMALASAAGGPPQTLYNLAFSVFQPIFDGGRLRGQLDRNRARYDELLADYSKTARQAFADVEDALGAVRDTGAAQTADQAALGRMQAALAMSRAGYAAGAVDLPTLQAAQAAVYPAEAALDQARLAHLQSLVLLYQALGGGWSLPS